MATQPMTSHRHTMNRADITVIVALFGFAVMLFVLAQVLGLSLL